MTSAKELAKYIIYLIKQQMKELQPEEFDVTPLKLQKLLYYCQGYSLALTGKPIFSEPIEAWKYGPVVKSVYLEYKKYDRGIIPLNEIVSMELDNTACSIAQLVVSEKGRYSGIMLADDTHKERPYVESYHGPYSNHEISLDSLKEYFSEQFVKWEESDDEEDEFWLRAGEPATKAELEALLADV